MTWRPFAALALASVLLGTSARADGRRKVIIDQDAFDGVNLQPLLMVIESPDVEVVGITVESGDGWQKESVAQTLRMLELIGRTDIPVAAGATYPLLNSEEETIRWEALYGRLAYKGAWMRTWPDYNTVNRPHYHSAEIVPPLAEGLPTGRPVPEPAAVFLAEKARASPGQISILALGPFTNLALAVKLDEGFAANAKELVFMGGSLNPNDSRLDEFSMQFVHSPRVEFNFRWDPEAARIMLHAGWKHIVAIPTDATVGTRLTPALAKEAAAGGTPAARYFGRWGQVGFPMWDETAAAAWLDPGLVRRRDRMAMDVAVDHGADYGATLSWAAGGGPGLGEPDIEVVRAIDIPGLERLFVRLLAGKGAAP
ncbi:MAG TPA: nucleoside hydrolase [Opitutaceae bacterium]|nr:nucleoside hydrolase [Opitutaceae bacterium]